MHVSNLELWKHQHSFGADKQTIEKKTLLVVIITFTMMIAEILFGLITNSMALLSDGWHMGTHAFALAISFFAYVLARKQAKNSSFVFGTWKIEILGAYSSALILGMVGVAMVYASIERLWHPLTIHYNEALFVAVIGLLVNFVCALILHRGSHSHSAGHSHGHEHGETQRGHDDLNFKSAYLHVIADALTSVFAIFALLGAKYFALNWLDPVMGIVGATMIGRWAVLLIKDSSKILLNRESHTPLSAEIHKQVESDGDSRICDLHLWRVSDAKYASIISIVSGKQFSIDDYRKRLLGVHGLAHITIEVNRCSDGPINSGNDHHDHAHPHDDHDHEEHGHDHEASDQHDHPHPHSNDDHEEHGHGCEASDQHDHPHPHPHEDNDHEEHGNDRESRNHHDHPHPHPHNDDEGRKRELGKGRPTEIHSQRSR